jgi:hypothetical protein
MAFLGYTVILLVEKIIFDTNNEKKKENNDKEYIELEKINETYKSPEIKLVNINNNFNISLESIAEQPDKERKKSKSRTVKDNRSPFSMKMKSKLISTVRLIVILAWLTVSR